jgi:hypothetical protein
VSKATLQLYGWSVLIAIGMLVLVEAIAGIPGFDIVEFIFAPGMLLAAVVFPQGLHSDHANAYLILACVLDALLLAVPVMFGLRAIKHRRRYT